MQKQIDGSNLVRAIPSSQELKLSTVQIKRLRNKEQERILKMREIKQIPGKRHEDTESRLIAKSMRKGLTPKRIIDDLQEDFLAHGLDAYEQFKRMNIGVAHDDDGVAYFEKRDKDGTSQPHKLADPADDPARSVYGFPGTPAWIGDKTMAAGTSRMVEAPESQAYLDRKNPNPSKPEKRLSDKGTSLARLVHHITNKEGGGPEDGSDGGGDGPDRGG